MAGLLQAELACDPCRERSATVCWRHEEFAHVDTSHLSLAGLRAPKDVTELYDALGVLGHEEFMDVRHFVAASSRK